MDHANKIQLMFTDFPRRGIGAWTFAPPVYRLLWKLGVAIPPPHFSTFWFLFAFQGGLFASAWGLLVGLAFWTWLPLPLWLLVTACVCAAVLFGLSMALYYRWKSRSCGLPPWSDYGRA